MKFDRYPKTTTRFLRDNERLILSEEKEMPLVIEANDLKNLEFLQKLLKTHSKYILEDISNYGAMLLRGFEVHSEKDFEETILSIEGMHGISEAFMSEEGRIHVGKSKYVLHTNAVYKTGGTLYLGGFHSENYYSPDVPSYICFCCFKPSQYGGETGLVHMGKVYQHLNDQLKKRLTEKTFFVTKWLISEVSERYHISSDSIVKICQHFNIPIVGEKDQQLILMYKPNVSIHPVTKQDSLQINLFEVPNLNIELRKCFNDDYQGNQWFWHRLVWKLPKFIFSTLEFFYIIFASFFYSPRNALKTLKIKYKTHQASRKNLRQHDMTRVGSCFQEEDIQTLAQLIRTYYSSCLWEKGDILLVDNRQVMHAGMPGAGPRVIRAMICNPIQMNYSPNQPGIINSVESKEQSIGFQAQSGSDQINSSHE